MHYYNALIYTYGDFSPDTDNLQSQTLSPDAIVALAKIKLETLVRLYYVHHGFDYHDVFMIQFLMFLGFMQVRALATLDTKESKDDYRSRVFLAAKGLRNQGQNYYLAEVVFNMMRDSLNSSDQRFLGTILNIGAEDEARRSLIAQHTRSVWAINIVSINDDPEKQRLGNLIKDTDSAVKGT